MQSVHAHTLVSTNTIVQSTLLNTPAVIALVFRAAKASPPMMTTCSVEAYVGNT